jgi:hypothetical protein
MYRDCLEDCLGVGLRISLGVCVEDSIGSVSGNVRRIVINRRCNCILILHVCPRRPPEYSPSETADSFRLYNGNHRKVVDLFLSISEWNCLLEDSFPIEGTFFDVVLRHVVFRADPDIRC